MKNFKPFKQKSASAPNQSRTTKKDFSIKGGVFRFQIGLVIGLAVCYALIESAFAVPNIPVNNPKTVLEDDKVYVMPDFEIEEVKNKKINNEPVAKSQVTDEVKVVDNDTKVEAKKEFINKTDAVEVDVDDIVVPTIEEDPGPISIVSVEFVPVYPGCESLASNDEKRECMSEKINRIVQKNFNTSIASDYGLSGRLRIDVQFKIDKQGNVSDVKVRAPHPSLEHEAERVTKLIPQMKPGKQGNKEVEVVFLKPIIFKVE
ncbi:energy transducer TonB [Galbibacter pacificus]|uniref:Energy transducer TonB n=1 Tax=Galbibacter pacificus TaxID=2996052 RepID=A0ABT6FSQ9_9FLAO|nr:energy transducer TonB [Galbibacter pacificus]MDG3582577.1 energy transducer TonB [Galbibacter pacificus]MDG3586304.1 energy transducer TonB [Galbibacter pacificus]